MQDASGYSPELGQQVVPPAGIPAREHVKGKNLIIVGAIGAILLGVGAMAFTVSFVTSGFYWYRSIGYPIAIIVSSIIVFVGMIVHSFAHAGYYVHHKSGMGMATFIFSIIVSVLFIALMVLSVQTDYWGYYYDYNYYLNPLFVWVASIILGVGVVIIGVSHILARKSLASPSIFMASGVIYIISGSFIMSLIFAFFIPVGWILLFVAAILTTIGLFLSLPHLGELPLPRPAIAPSAPQPLGAHISGTAMNFCPKCGGRVDGFSFCPSCGTELSR
ncbi:MAG: zinc ribbon domain-containing protein [Methanomassiliicoccales archaeon]|nr:MAG: zinc ribbon domain-containing protein [Methanomassiliicoccales archaeon]